MDSTHPTPSFPESFKRLYPERKSESGGDEDSHGFLIPLSLLGNILQVYLVEDKLLGLKTGAGNGDGDEGEENRRRGNYEPLIEERWAQIFKAMEQMETYRLLTVEKIKIDEEARRRKEEKGKSKEKETADGNNRYDGYEISDNQMIIDQKKERKRQQALKEIGWMVRLELRRWYINHQTFLLFPHPHLPNPQPSNPSRSKPQSRSRSQPHPHSHPTPPPSPPPPTSSSSRRRRRRRSDNEEEDFKFLNQLIVSLLSPSSPNDKYQDSQFESSNNRIGWAKPSGNLFEGEQHEEEILKNFLKWMLEGLENLKTSNSNNRKRESEKNEGKGKGEKENEFEEGNAVARTRTRTNKGKKRKRGRDEDEDKGIDSEMTSLPTTGKGNGKKGNGMATTTAKTTTEDNNNNKYTTNTGDDYYSLPCPSFSTLTPTPLNDILCLAQDWVGEVLKDALEVDVEGEFGVRVDVEGEMEREEEEEVMGERGEKKVGEEEDRVEEEEEDRVEEEEEDRDEMMVEGNKHESESESVEEKEIEELNAHTHDQESSTSSGRNEIGRETAQEEKTAQQDDGGRDEEEEKDENMYDEVQSQIDEEEEDHQVDVDVNEEEKIENREVRARKEGFSRRRLRKKYDQEEEEPLEPPPEEGEEGLDENQDRDREEMFSKKKQRKRSKARKLLKRGSFSMTTRQRGKERRREEEEEKDMGEGEGQVVVDQEKHSEQEDDENMPEEGEIDHHPQPQRTTARSQQPSQCQQNLPISKSTSTRNLSEKKIPQHKESQAQLQKDGGEDTDSHVSIPIPQETSKRTKIPSKVTKPVSREPVGSVKEDDTPQEERGLNRHVEEEEPQPRRITRSTAAAQKAHSRQEEHPRSKPSPVPEVRPAPRSRTLRNRRGKEEGVNDGGDEKEEEGIDRVDEPAAVEQQVVITKSSKQLEKPSRRRRRQVKDGDEGEPEAAEDATEGVEVGTYPQRERRRRRVDEMQGVRAKLGQSANEEAQAHGEKRRVSMKDLAGFHAFMDLDSPNGELSQKQSRKGDDSSRVKILKNKGKLILESDRMEADHLNKINQSAREEVSFEQNVPIFLPPIPDQDTSLNDNRSKKNNVDQSLEPVSPASIHPPPSPSRSRTPSLELGHAQIIPEEESWQPPQPSPDQASDDESGSTGREERRRKGEKGKKAVEGGGLVGERSFEDTRIMEGGKGVRTFRRQPSEVRLRKSSSVESWIRDQHAIKSNPAVALSPPSPNELLPQVPRPRPFQPASETQMLGANLPTPGPFESQEVRELRIERDQTEKEERRKRREEFDLETERKRLTARGRNAEVEEDNQPERNSRSRVSAPAEFLPPPKQSPSRTNTKGKQREVVEERDPFLNPEYLLPAPVARLRALDKDDGIPRQLQQRSSLPVGTAGLSINPNLKSKTSSFKDGLGGKWKIAGPRPSKGTGKDKRKSREKGKDKDKERERLVEGDFPAIGANLKGEQSSSRPNPTDERVHSPETLAHLAQVLQGVVPRNDKPPGAKRRLDTSEANTNSNKPSPIPGRFADISPLPQITATTNGDDHEQPSSSADVAATLRANRNRDHQIDDHPDTTTSPSYPTYDFERAQIHSKVPAFSSNPVALSNIQEQTEEEMIANSASQPLSHSFGPNDPLHLQQRLNRLVKEYREGDHHPNHQQSSGDQSEHQKNKSGSGSGSRSKSHDVSGLGSFPQPWQNPPPVPHPRFASVPPGGGGAQNSDFLISTSQSHSHSQPNSKEQNSGSRQDTTTSDSRRTRIIEPLNFDLPSSGGNSKESELPFQFRKGGIGGGGDGGEVFGFGMGVEGSAPHDGGHQTTTSITRSPTGDLIMSQQQQQFYVDGFSSSFLRPQEEEYSTQEDLFDQLVRKEKLADHDHYYRDLPREHHNHHHNDDDDHGDNDQADISSQAGHDDHHSDSDLESQARLRLGQVETVASSEFDDTEVRRLGHFFAEFRG